MKCQISFGKLQSKRDALYVAVVYGIYSTLINHLCTVYTVLYLIDHLLGSLYTRWGR